MKLLDGDIVSLQRPFVSSSDDAEELDDGNPSQVPMLHIDYIEIDGSGGAVTLSSASQ